MKHKVYKLISYREATKDLANNFMMSSLQTLARSVVCYIVMISSRFIII